MTSKITYILVLFFSPTLLPWCHSSEDVFDYIFGNDEDDIFGSPKPPQPAETVDAPVKESIDVPVQKPVEDSVNEPKKEVVQKPKKEVVQEPPEKLIPDITKKAAEKIADGSLGFVPLRDFLKMGVPTEKPVKDSVNEPKKEVVQEPPQKLIPDIIKEAAEEITDGSLGFVPLKEFLKMGVPLQKLFEEAPPVNLATEDGQDAPLGQFLKITEAPVKKKKKNKKKKRRRSAKYIMRQVDKLGNKGAPQALMAFSFVLSALSRGVKGLKSVVDSSTSMSSKTVETVSNANTSTIDTMQGMLNGTANAAMRQVNSWADTLDLLRKSMSGSVKKKVDKGHSITITTSSDAPIKTLASFADKWGNGGALTGNGQKGGGKSSSMLPMMPPVLPEVTSVDFSNFWK